MSLRFQTMGVPFLDGLEGLDFTRKISWGEETAEKRCGRGRGLLSGSSGHLLEIELIHSAVGATDQQAFPIG